MRRSEIEAIGKLIIERAIDAIKHIKPVLEKEEKFWRELDEWYPSMIADKTSSELERFENEGGLIASAGRAKPTPAFYAALEWRTEDGQPITTWEQREDILSDVAPLNDVAQDQPTSDWRESSRQAAELLRAAEMDVAAIAIDIELNRLPKKQPRDAEERQSYIEAERSAVDQVKTILETCLEFSVSPTKPDQTTKPESGAGKSADKGTETRYLALLGLYTNGLANEKFAEIVAIFESDKSVPDRLKAMHEVLKIPPTISAEKLGKIFGVSKPAIQKTPWYIANRKGKADENVNRRQDVHKEKAKQYEPKFRGDD